MENEISGTEDISDLSVDQFAEALLVEAKEDATDDDETADQSDDLEAAEADAEADEDHEEIDPDEDQEEDTEEPVFDVTIDGQSVSVPLSELTKGYSRQSDYTRKMQDLADTRQKAEQAQAQYSEKQQQLETALTKWAIQSANEPDWVDLSQKLDPRDFQKAQAQWMQHKQRREDARAQLAEIQAEHRQAEAQKLLQSIPEWGDEAVKTKELTQIVQHAEHYGFSNAELEGVTDHRVFRLLRDAVIGREAQKATKEAAQKRVTKAAKAPPQRGPAAKGQAKRVASQKSLDALRKTGSEDAFAAWLRT